MYDASLGRWHVVDPLADVITSINPYNYVYNNALSFNDPTGMLPAGRLPSSDEDHLFKNPKNCICSTSNEPEDRWKLNTETGDVEWINDDGGSEVQYIHFNDNTNPDVTVQGAEFYVGPTRKYTGGGGISHTASRYDLWSDIPDEYLGHYNSFDLIERYKALNDSDSDLKISVIREQENLLLDRKDMEWNARDFADLNMGDNTSSFVMAGKLDMVPTPAGSVAGAAHAGRVRMMRHSKRVRALRSSKSVKARTKGFSNRGRATPKNRFNRFTNKNAGSWRGKGWQGRAVQIYKMRYGGN